MNDLLERCCGIDIHKDIIVAFILNWPIYETLEDSFNGNISLLVANARYMKNVPGKKTDMKDAEWIATLLRAGLLNGSFIPDKGIRELRDLTRYRKSIIHDITSQKNRIEKFLQSSGFRLSTFISDIFGASGRYIISCLIDHGQINKSQLNECLKTKTRQRIDDIMIAVNRTLSIHQRNFLKMLASHLDVLNSHLKDIKTSITAEINQFSSAMTALCSIPGIAETAAASIIAEIGIDMSRFKAAEHIYSWAGLSP